MATRVRVCREERVSADRAARRRLLTFGISVLRADMGSGRFAALLPYKDWLHFNNVQRGHQNFLEGLPSFYASLFSVGVLKPMLAARLGAL